MTYVVEYSLDGGVLRKATALTSSAFEARAWLLSIFRDVGVMLLRVYKIAE